MILPGQSWLRQTTCTASPAGVMGLTHAYIASDEAYGQLNIIATSDPTYGSSNANNDYDYIGHLHNDALLFLYNHSDWYSAQGGGWDIEKLMAHMDSVVSEDSHFGSHHLDDWGTADDVLAYFQNTHYDEEINFLDSCDTWLGFELINAYTCDFMKSYWQEASEIDDHGDFQSFTVEIENFADTTSIPIERQIVLQSLSVAKNSESFWYNHIP